MTIQQDNTAFLFPGQGSQAVGMGSELIRIYSSAREVFQIADEELGIPLAKVMMDGPEDVLNDTINTQPAILAHSIASLKTFYDIVPGFVPKFVAGHSMGEITALVAAKSLTFNVGIKFARDRGKLMKQAGEIAPGGMAAILALELPLIEKICVEASTRENLVQIANDNCPGQVVISGHTRALETAMNLSKEAGAKKVVRLAVSIASHSPLMRVVQNEFFPIVEKLPLSIPKINIVGNVKAQPLQTPDEIRDDLQSQLGSMVRWREIIIFMLKNGVDTFIEFGRGDVLTGLVKRIDRKTKRITLGKPEDYQKLETFV
jgi:[acyl-carrier-protein] S-malonyltransferase